MQSRRNIRVKAAQSGGRRFVEIAKPLMGVFKIDNFAGRTQRAPDQRLRPSPIIPRTSSADNSRRARPRSMSFNAALKSGRLSTRVPSRSKTSAAAPLNMARYNNGQNIASISTTINAHHATNASLFSLFCARSSSSNKRIVAGWSSKIRTWRTGAAHSRSRIGLETITDSRRRVASNWSDVTSNRR